MAAKLPISVGILAFKSGQTLVDTLYSYHTNGLFNIVNDVTILFQEYSNQDLEIAKHFGLNFIALHQNIGIGKAFIKLTEVCDTDHVLILEHDWKLIEDEETTYQRLLSGMLLLNSDFQCIRYRHRSKPGHPHFSFRHRGNELNYYDEEIGCKSPHLLDSLHWLDPAEKFPDKIRKEDEYYMTTSRWANWTNNPCMYKKDFYLQTVKQFAGDGIALEGNISKWWAQQTFNVAHGEGLFSHIDLLKYGK